MRSHAGLFQTLLAFLLSSAMTSCLTTSTQHLPTRCCVERRSPDVRAALLDRGAEALLRQVKAAHPSCADAGSAALRDLGLDNYNS